MFRVCIQGDFLFMILQNSAVLKVLAIPEPRPAKVKASGIVASIQYSVFTHPRGCLQAIKLTPPEFSIGLAIFCVVPTTLGVGVALTAASKGNQALALLLTVATNLLGIITVPYELKLLLRGSNVVSVEPGPLVLKLVLTVLVPSVIGKVLTATSPQVRNLVRKYR